MPDDWLRNTISFHFVFVTEPSNNDAVDNTSVDSLDGLLRNTVHTSVDSLDGLLRNTVSLHFVFVNRPSSRPSPDALHKNTFSLHFVFGTEPSRRSMAR